MMRPDYLIDRTVNEMSANMGEEREEIVVMDFFVRGEKVVASIHEPCDPPLKIPAHDVLALRLRDEALLRRSVAPKCK